jgi:hypothetical protein
LCKANLHFKNNAFAQHTAEKAFLRVLNYSGASLARDFVDTRIVNETRNGTATYSGSVTLRPGIIDTQNDVGGWPTYNSTAAPTDTDADGIPDGWLEANYPGKTANQLNAEGYTYLELYINSLVNNITVNQNADAVISGIENKITSDKSDIYAIYNFENQKIILKSDLIVNKVIVSDLTGRTLKVISNSDQINTIDVAGLTSSVYLISVYSKNIYLKTIKVIK